MRYGLSQVVQVLVAAYRRSIDLGEAFAPRYTLDLHDHDTGTHVQITAHLERERLIVWDYHYWKSGQYEFNNRDKTLGLQVAGPWADEIDAILDSIQEKINAAIAAEEQAKRDAERAEMQKHADKIERFRNAFSKVTGSAA